MSERVSKVGVRNVAGRVTGLSVVLQLAVVTLAYWLAAIASLRLALVHGQVTPIWPPTGIALVAILVFGRRGWPAVVGAAPGGHLPVRPFPPGAGFIPPRQTLAPPAAAACPQR